jgi:hypothetical protein
LTIMSCQLLRKSQEGASHPSPQVWLKIIIWVHHCIFSMFEIAATTYAIWLLYILF